MKKTLTAIFISLSLVIILDSMNAGSALFMFLLAGIVPGTDIILSPTATLSLFAALLGFVFSRILNSFVTINTQTEKSALQQA